MCCPGLKPWPDLTMKLSEMCEKERPREKLLLKGSESLSDGELLAILLRSGNPGENVNDLAQRLLSSVGGQLRLLFTTSPEVLCRTRGIGPAKASGLLAAFELGKRFVREQCLQDRRPFVTARQVYDLMIPQLKGLDHEECWVLYLDASNCLVERRKMTVGGAQATVMDSGQIVRSAMERGARGIILVHNHPSGIPDPSSADIRQTELLHSALDACGLSLLDHVVVADYKFYSFADSRTYPALQIKK